MLAIRMQRTGRKGHAQFRIIVQEAQLSPKSGRVVQALGNYDPHSKVVNLDKEKAAYYLEHGAQPSSRVAVLLKNEGVKLPKWVAVYQSKNTSIKNTEKLRRNRPAEDKTQVEESPVEVPSVDEALEAEVQAEESPTETKEEIKAEEAQPTEAASEEAKAE